MRSLSSSVAQARLCISSLVEYLKSHRGFVTTTELSKGTGIDLFAPTNKTLRDDLAKNLKVAYKDEVWSYVSFFPHIRCQQDLVATLQTMWPRGLNVTKLSDTYEGVLKDVEELTTNQLILRVTNTEEKHDVIFWNIELISKTSFDGKSTDEETMEEKLRDEKTKEETKEKSAHEEKGDLKKILKDIFRSISVPWEKKVDDYLLEHFSIPHRKENRIVKLIPKTKSQTLKKEEKLQIHI